MRKILIVAEMRALEKQVHLGEISYSRMIEIINDKADTLLSDKLLLAYCEIDELTKEKSLFIEKYTKSCDEVQKLEKVNDELTKETMLQQETLMHNEAELISLREEVERLRKDRELFEKRCVNLSKSTDEILEYLIPFVDNYLDDNDINRIIKWHNDNSNRH